MSVVVVFVVGHKVGQVLLCALAKSHRWRVSVVGLYCKNETIDRGYPAIDSGPFDLVFI